MDWKTQAGLSVEANGFVRTLNKMGYMTAQWDHIADRCFAFSRGKQGWIADIGAAYGLTTLPLLEQGNRVIAIDLEPRHLAILTERVPNSQRDRLSTIVGAFPRGVEIAAESLDAVLASSVLHFLDGQEIEAGARTIFGWLQPGGKVFISANSPYVKSLVRFHPVYEANVERGERFPGLIRDVHKWVDSHRAPQLPAMLHFLDPTVLARSFRNAGFVVEYAEFFHRPDCASDIAYDGREFVGLVAEKPRV